MDNLRHLPADRYAAYRTHCENAFYSLVLDADKSSEGGKTKVDLAYELQRLYYVNIPGTLPVVAPEVLMGAPASAPKPENKIQYDDNYILPDDASK